jgi:hypothetical protein
MDVTRMGGTLRTHRSRWLLLLAAALSVGLVGPRPGAASDVTPFTVSIPTATGPIASTPPISVYRARLLCRPPVPDGYVSRVLLLGDGDHLQYAAGISSSPCPAVATLRCTIPTPRGCS